MASIRADQQAVYQRLLASSLSVSERARVSRTLARLEGCHRNELTSARRASNEALAQLQDVQRESELATHTHAAHEAKYRAQIEELRGQASRLELQLSTCETQRDTALARAYLAEAQLLASETALVSEVAPALTA